LLENGLSLDVPKSDNNHNEISSVANENSKKVMKNSEDISQVFDSIMSEMISTNRTINNIVAKRDDKDIDEEVDFNSIISGISIHGTINNMGEKRDDKDIEEVNIVPKRDMDDNMISSVSPKFSFDFSLESIMNQNNKELMNSPVVSPKNSFGFHSFERIMKQESPNETTTNFTEQKTNTPTTK